MQIAQGIISESYILLLEMSVYLLFGYFFAGILHIFLRPETIAAHLGKNNMASVIKASLFGIPLPLCSCGVIPAALSLKREGASKGAVLSFLISTPTTGIDSIFATLALLGGVFTLYRIGASFVVAFCVGILANVCIKDSHGVCVSAKKNECKLCQKAEQHSHGLNEKIREVFRYAFVDLLADSGSWLVIGILIGGAISFFMPTTFVEQYLGSGIISIIVMFIVGVPMYVCASGSIPIAVALMLKGLNPGAAFVFLLAGPATNAVTMTVVLKELGLKALIIYVSTMFVCSVLLALGLDATFRMLGGYSTEMIMQHQALFPEWIKIASSIILLFFIGYNSFKKNHKKTSQAH